MGDVTIPRNMTEKPRCRKPPFYGQLSSNREAQSKVQVIVVCVCYFLQKNRKQTNSSFFKKPAKVPWDNASSYASCMRTTGMSSAIFKRAICSK